LYRFVAHHLNIYANITTRCQACPESKNSLEFLRNQN